MGAAYLNAPDIEVIQRCKKVPWPSRQMAQRRVRKMNKPSGLVCVGEGVMKAYRCPICQQWHVGHLPVIH